MAEQEAADVDEQPGTNDPGEDGSEAGAEDSGVADAVDERASELTGGADAGGGGGSDQPISEINRPAVEAATEHLDEANLADDRETLKKLQQDM